MLNVESASPRISADYPQVFSVQGVIGPICVLTSLECELLNAYIESGAIEEPFTWSKGYACSDRLIFGIATKQNILDQVEQLLGPDLYLWGASIIVKQPGQAHHWHTDIETADPEGRFVSVWIGVRNTSSKTGLQFIEQSHLIGKPLQEVTAEKRVSRAERSAEVSLALAKQYRSSCSLSQKEIHDGEAFFFDGRVWHGSLNADDVPRKALLLQYASNTSAVRIPDSKTLEYPFKYKNKYPPGLIVRGRPQGAGRAVSPPQSREKKLTEASLLQIRPDATREPWRPYHLFQAATSSLDVLSAHFSVLQPGHSPHPPHKHIEEELLIIVEGIAEVIVGDRLEPHTLTCGDFAYYPSYYQHTIRNRSERPVVYLMFKWRGLPLGSESQLEAGVFLNPGVISDSPEKKFNSKLIFEGPTHFLTKLHVHHTYVLTGGGYEPHEDDYDVLIILIDGKLSTMGQIMEAPALLYHPAGTSHGLRSIGDRPARYIVVEMHGTRDGFDEQQFSRFFPFAGWSRAQHDFKRLVLRQLRKMIPGHMRQEIKRVVPWITR